MLGLDAGATGRFTRGATLDDDVRSTPDLTLADEPAVGVGVLLRELAALLSLASQGPRPGWGPGVNVAEATIAESLRDAYVRVGPDGVVTLANAPARRLLAGGSSVRVVGTPLRRFVAPGDLPQVEEALAGRPQGVRVLDDVHVGSGSAPRAATAAVADAGTGTRWLFRPREPEAPPRAEVAGFERLVRHLPGVYTSRADALATCEYASRGLEELLGRRLAGTSQIARSWVGQIHADDRERVLSQRLEAIEAGRPSSLEYRIRRPDGTVRWVHDVAGVEMEGPRAVRLHGVVIDVTARHTSEQLLEQIYEDARDEIDRLGRRETLRTTFLRLLTHELRSPLATAEAVAATLLQDDARLARAERHDLVERARSDLRHARDLVNGVLQGEYDARSGPSRQPTDVGQLVADVVAELDPAGHPLVVEGAATLDLDPFIVGRAVANLVNNAVTHTPAGTPVRVRVVESEEPTGVVIVVEDEGPGLDDTEKEHVFEPFVRLDVVAGGAGLGLDLVRRLAELHGGRAWVEDVEGGGAAFHLFIPRGRDLDPR